MNNKLLGLINKETKKIDDLYDLHGGNLFFNNQQICVRNPDPIPIRDITYNNPNDWHILNFISSGKFGVTFTARHKICSETFIIKFVVPQNSSNDVLEEIYIQTKASERNIAPKILDHFMCTEELTSFWTLLKKEVEERINHNPYDPIRKTVLFESYTTIEKFKNKHVIVMEYGGITLSDFLERLITEDNKYRRLENNLHIFIEIMLVIIELLYHKFILLVRLNIVHHDLHIKNILVNLIDSSIDIKIIDFGLAKIQQGALDSVLKLFMGIKWEIDRYDDYEPTADKSDTVFLLFRDIMKNLFDNYEIYYKQPSNTQDNKLRQMECMRLAIKSICEPVINSPIPRVSHQAMQLKQLCNQL